MTHLRTITAIGLTLLFQASSVHAQLSADSTSQPSSSVLQAFEEGMRIELALLATSIKDSARQSKFASDIARTTAKVERSLDISPWKVQGLRVWNALPTRVDHWHRYTVAEIKGALFRLGGFAAPELVDLDRVLPRAEGGLVGRATLLATLADRNGGEQLSILDSSSVSLPSGGTIVWVHTESLQSRAYRPIRWTCFYSFLFARDGTLLQWARFERNTGG